MQGVPFAEQIEAEPSMDCFTCGYADVLQICCAACLDNTTILYVYAALMFSTMEYVNVIECV